MRLAAPILLALLILAGCTAQKETTRRVDRLLIDSLYTVNVELRQQLYALQDTFKLYDAIDTGRYYRERRQLLDRIDKLSYDLAVAQDAQQEQRVGTGETIEVLLADDLFAPASATLTAGGMQRIDALAARLKRDYAGRQLRIEGYSDNVPLGPNLQARYPSNWELSAARAAAVVRYLTERHALAADRFEVVGFGASQPVAGNETAEGRRRNRRVRVAAW